MAFLGETFNLVLRESRKVRGMSTFRVGDRVSVNPSSFHYRRLQAAVGTIVRLDGKGVRGVEYPEAPEAAPELREDFIYDVQFDGKKIIEMLAESDLVGMPNA